MNLFSRIFVANPSKVSHLCIISMLHSFCQYWKIKKHHFRTFTFFILVFLFLIILSTDLYHYLWLILRSCKTMKIWLYNLYCWMNLASCCLDCFELVWHNWYFWHIVYTICFSFKIIILMWFHSLCMWHLHWDSLIQSSLNFELVETNLIFIESASSYSSEREASMQEMELIYGRHTCYTGVKWVVYVQYTGEVDDIH